MHSSGLSAGSHLHLPTALLAGSQFTLPSQPRPPVVCLCHRCTADVPTVLLSYFVMLLYIAVGLARFPRGASWRDMLVHSRHVVRSWADPAQAACIHISAPGTARDAHPDRHMHASTPLPAPIIHTQAHTPTPTLPFMRLFTQGGPGPGRGADRCCRCAGVHGAVCLGGHAQHPHHC